MLVPRALSIDLIVKLPAELRLLEKPSLTWP
jgi:hypothetical protein